MTAKNLQAVRGMSDLLPGETPLWRFLEEQVRAVFDSYGLDEVRLPIVEPTELFQRSIGEHTDIVGKEMYTFEDRNGDSLTLRPEGTAGVVRACQQHGLLYNQTQRLWYAGPMFRHERPQKGRYRQFHQIGAEVFGFEGPDIDAELIAMTARLWKKLGLANHVHLELNSLGDAGSRARHRAALTHFLNGHHDLLDEDSQRRIQSNPLRVFDSKVPDTQAVLRDAPLLADFLDEASVQHFDRLCCLLDTLGIAYVHNPRLVRGLDYYGRTVFEWVTSSLGAQGTVCAGGRYDGLVEQLGGRPVPAVGFAMGVERLVLLLQQVGGVPEESWRKADFYIVCMDEQAGSVGLQLAEQLRDRSDVSGVVVNQGGGSLKAQMKRADRSGARFAVVLGPDELEKRQVTLKSLRDARAQTTVDFDQFIANPAQPSFG